MLERALNGMDPAFADMASLNEPATLEGADLLVLPYGSAVPVDAWKAMESYLHGGGNLLVVGGQPLRVPVTQADGKYEARSPRTPIRATLDFRHTYEVPVPKDARFAWKAGYALGADAATVGAAILRRRGAVERAWLHVDSAGLLVAAPVIVADLLVR